MTMWHALSLETVEHTGGKNGTVKFHTNGGKSPLRFQVPKGRVMFNGLSEYKSITIDMPEVFIAWWRETMEPTLIGSVNPFNSNLKETGLRLKVDKSTQMFNSKKEIYFPDLTEGLLSRATVQCIIEISGTYFFQGNHGLTIRAHQIVVSSTAEADADTSVADAETESTTLKGFAFI